MERHKSRSIQVQMLKMQKYVIENEGNRAELADYEVYELAKICGMAVRYN